ncbi:unnamed protein product [Closterium sp. NIES-53]
MLAAPCGPLSAPYYCLPSALRCLPSPHSACYTTMASLNVLGFNHEGHPLQFDTWLDDLQLYLLSNFRDSVSLFDHTSGVAPAPPATAHSATRSQWLTRNAAACLAIRNHLPLAKCAHFGQHRTAHALYDAVDTRYSSPASAALGRLLLPYLFPEMSAFATVEDLVSHLRTTDARYRAAAPAESLDRNQPSMFITLNFIVTRLPDSLRSVKDHFLSLDPTVLTIDLLEQHLLVAKTTVVAVGAARGTPRTPFFEGCSPSPLAPSYASAAAVDVSSAEDVGPASASAKRHSSKGKGGRGGGGGSGSGGGGSSGGGGCSGDGGSGGGSGGFGGGGGGSSGSGGSGNGESGGGRNGAQRGGSSAQSLPVPPLFLRVQRFRSAHCQVFTSPHSLRTWVEFLHTGYRASSGSCDCPGVRVRSGPFSLGPPSTSNASPCCPSRTSGVRRFSARRAPRVRVDFLPNAHPGCASVSARYAPWLCVGFCPMRALAARQFLPDARPGCALVPARRALPDARPGCASVPARRTPRACVGFCPSHASSARRFLPARVPCRHTRSSYPSPPPHKEGGKGCEGVADVPHQQQLPPCLLLSHGCARCCGERV